EIAFDLQAPETFPKKTEYNEAVECLSRGQWKRGRSILESLLEFGDQWPNLFRSLGIVEYWFVNDEKGRAYFDRYLASPGIDRESAIDVEQLLLLLVSPTWDDVAYLQKRVYTLEDFDSAYEKFLSSKRLVADSRLQSLVREDIPPKMGFLVLDKELTEKTEDVSFSEVALQCGYLFVYGKQTTRAARAEFYLFPEELASAESVLESSLGQIPPLETAEEQKDQPVLWTTNASTPHIQFKDPTKLTEETVKKVFDEGFVEFGSKWFEHKYASLGGKSPKEVLLEDSGDRRVEALIRIVADTFTLSYREQIASILRAKAGLSAPEPIAPPETFETTEKAIDFFREVPLWRWNRLQIEKCKASVLAELLQIANLAAPRDVKEKFAKEFLSRPVAETQYDDRACAYSISVDSAFLAGDFEEALRLVLEAGKYANDVGQSDSHWNVLEIMTRFRLQEYDEVRSFARHVFTEHKDDQEAIQTLQQFFAQLNANAQMQARAAEAYRLRSGQPAPASPAAPTGQSIVDFSVAGQNAPREEKNSGLWTPGSDDDARSQEGGSKLWIPD
ncbi:MAG: hypothetical protein J6X44_08070, partial [Thermoguttaceae bacterium]|nr:hypothetical protein [Thermoguttaceae bacterium]